MYDPDMRRRAPRRRMESKLPMLGIMLVVITLLLAFIPGVMKEKNALAEKNQEQAKLESQYAAEQERSTDLDKQKQYQKTDKYLEEIARKFGYIYKDEILIKPSDN